MRIESLGSETHQIEEGKPVPDGLPFPGAPDYVRYNFKFWDTCEHGGHDFFTRKDACPQCAVCGVLDNDVYREYVISDRGKAYFEETGNKAIYGWKGCWEVPTVKPSKRALWHTSKQKRTGGIMLAPGESTSFTLPVRSGNETFDIDCTKTVVRKPSPLKRLAARISSLLLD